MVDNRRSRGRAPRNRVITTRRNDTPRWVWIGLIASPIVLIALVLTLKDGKTPSDTGVGDPNETITRLEREVGEIRKSFREFFKLARAEDPSAKKKREELEARVKRWMSEWDEIFDSRRDADGDLPAELLGYQKTRSEVNEIRIDLVKATGF